MVQVLNFIFLIFTSYCYTNNVYCNEDPQLNEVRALKGRNKAAHSITVHMNTSLHECEQKYLSLVVNINGEWTQSKKVRTLALELSPAEVRAIGYELQLKSVQKAKTARPVLLDVRWDSFADFIRNVGWDLLYGVRHFKRKPSGFWDTSDIEQLLAYSSRLNLPISYFHIGNEPEAYLTNYNISITPEKLVEEYRKFKRIITNFKLYESSKLCGPEISSVFRRSSKEYLRGFLAAGASDVIDELSFHQYYLSGHTARAPEFLSVNVFDSLKTEFDDVNKIMREESPRLLPIRLSETSATYGGGGEMSFRYIAGFLWLDKLGVSAQYGITRVFRASFIGGSYGLINHKSYKPTPDYYLSVLYKRLIEGPVFNVTLDPPNRQLRVYAHCARNLLYSPGALVVYYVNLEEKETKLALPQFRKADLEVYSLTPGDQEGLQSKFVKLNGRKLVMNGLKLPHLRPKKQKGKVTVESQSFGFVVVPNANIGLCVDYFARTSAAK